eukprot:1139277-Amorphochlora_amoeboformis.AAC.1
MKDTPEANTPPTGTYDVFMALNRMNCASSDYSYLPSESSDHNLSRHLNHPSAAGINPFEALFIEDD